MEELKSIIRVWKTKYDQQDQAAKILIPSLGLLVFCCLCAFAFNLSSAGRRNALGITPSPGLSTDTGIQPTPTALFGFGLTPLSTLVAPSALPTIPGPGPTETATPLPTSTNPPATVANTGSVQIITVEKPAEYVDIQNTGNDPVDLNGWKLVSVTGNQPCTLSGILQPEEVLRVWARMGPAGLSCAYAFNIWNDEQSDPAVLYDARGKEVSRFP